MQLLNAIDTVGLVGLRDRVLFGRLGHNLRALAHGCRDQRPFKIHLYDSIETGCPMRLQTVLF
jgi:hypothetical protein